MNEHDRNLQERIEAGDQHIGAGIDAKIYRKLFDVLNSNEEPSKLTPSFADKMVVRIAEMEKSKQSSKDLWWLGAGAILLVLALVISLSFITFTVDFNFLKALADYKGLLVTAVLLVTIFNWLDRRLVSKKVS